MFKKVILFFLLKTFFLANILHAQSVIPYIDKFGHFMVFDNGKVHQLEFLPIKDIKMGSDFLIYTDATDNLKLYKNNNVLTLEAHARSKYQTTAFLTHRQSSSASEIILPSGQKIMVDINGQAQPFMLGDSILAFINHSGNLRAFLHGETYTIDNGFDIQQNSFKVSNNTLAYTNSAGVFYMFYKNEAQEIDNQKPIKYWVGSGWVAYVNNYNEFVVFYNGENIVLENFVPKSYKAGYNTLAYVSTEGNLKVWYNGQVHTLTNTLPVFYEIINNTVVYTNDNQYFSVFFENKNEAIETYLPTEIAIANGIVAYTDNNNRLKAWIKGKKHVVSEQVVEPLPMYTAANLGFDIYNTLVRHYVFSAKKEAQAVQNGRNMRIRIGGEAILYSTQNGEPTVFFEGKRY